jgi:hypothetical protein
MAPAATVSFRGKQQFLAMPLEYPVMLDDLAHQDAA